MTALGFQYEGLIAAESVNKEVEIWAELTWPATK